DVRADAGPDASTSPFRGCARWRRAQSNEKARQLPGFLATRSLRTARSEERTHSERDASPRQRRVVLQERGVHPRVLVQQVGAVEEQFPRGLVARVEVPRKVGVDERVAGRLL